jgi:uncharacterized protein (DUF952 family)
MAFIYHVITGADWTLANEKGFYEAASVATEGFMHCSDKDQVAGVLDRYYQGVNDLLLLHIDTALLQHPLKYELAPSTNEEFPHLFGSLNLDAVVAAVRLRD